MPTVIAHHDVKDTEHWLASPRRDEFFGPLGVTNIRTFVDPENPSRVALLMDIPDLDAVAAAMQTEAAAAAMAHDGVLPETQVLLVEALRRRRQHAAPGRPHGGAQRCGDTATFTVPSCRVAIGA